VYQYGQPLHISPWFLQFEIHILMEYDKIDDVIELYLSLDLSDLESRMQNLRTGPEPILGNR
jgi:hypothetical protein